MLSYILLAPVWPLPPVFMENPWFIAVIVVMAIGWIFLGFWALLILIRCLGAVGKWLMKRFGL